MKTCSKCKIEKPVSDFYKKSANKDGLQVHCKICQKLTQRLWKQKNPEKRRQLYKLYYERNPEKRKEKYRKRQKIDTEKISTHYIIQLIGVKSDKIPKELIEVKRLQIQIYRHLKELKK